MSEEPSSALLSPIFASERMNGLFSDRGILQAMLDFEAALAAAEAETGVIPAEAAPPIVLGCDASLYEPGGLGRAAALAGNVAIPLVKALTARVPEAARGYVHWGATSQDVIDTAFMLIARRALAIVADDLGATMRALISLTEAHRATLMPGRTWLQHAVPITFGHKAATWLAGVIEARRRLFLLHATSIALQFGGAAGNLSALGVDGLKVRAALAARLGLAEAPITWHAERGRIADIAFALASLSGLAAKIATDVLLLMQTEVGEAFEPAAAGKGGSSTMPHKRNPVAGAAIRANHRRISGLAATIAIGLEQEHERAPGGWSAEWETLRDLFRLTGGSVERLRDLLAGLEVDPRRMRDNLDSTMGLPLAESLMMTLAPKIGRAAAHHRVEAASKRAIAERRPLAEIAKSEPAIVGTLSAHDIDRALNPANYLGTSDAMIEAVLAAARRELESE